MKLTIKQALNGYIVTADNEEAGGGVADTVFLETIEEFEGLLYLITELVGPKTNRYSEKRIRITTVPGDKFVGENEDVGI